MYAGKLVFAQVMEFAPWHTFRRLVAKYRGDFNVRTFSCLDQFLSMAFAQITFRESLRDIEACLEAHAAKAYHLGLRGNFTRSNLADANERCDWRLYCEFAQALIRIAQSRLNVDLSLHSMLQVLSVTPFEKMPLFQLFSAIAEDPNMPRDDNQLNLL
jgi:hypothetical protein